MLLILSNKIKKNVKLNIFYSFSHKILDKWNFRFLSLNVGMKSNLAGLASLLLNKKFDVVFLQEVKITDDQLQCQVGRYGYVCQVNINSEDFSKPGTAMV